MVKVENKNRKGKAKISKVLTIWILSYFCWGRERETTRIISNRANSYETAFVLYKNRVVWGGKVKWEIVTWPHERFGFSARAAVSHTHRAPLMKIQLDWNYVLISIMENRGGQTTAIILRTSSFGRARSRRSKLNRISAMTHAITQSSLPTAAWAGGLTPPSLLWPSINRGRRRMNHVYPESRIDNRLFRWMATCAKDSTSALANIYM